VPALGGFTTATKMSGTTGAFQRKDPLRLAERYEVNENAERIAELMRFIYLGRIDYLKMIPQSV